MEKTIKTHIPKYKKLEQDMLRKFSDMSYYSPLPGERELCEIFGVSRPTVRKALELLEQSKKIVRIQGKGSFFLGNKVHVDSSKKSGIAFYHEVSSLGGYTKSKILTQNVENATQDIAIRLNINQDQQVFHLERLRYIGEELYSLANSYIPFDLCPELLKIDFTNISLYNTLEEHGIYPYRAEKVLEIKPAKPYEAMHLGIQQNDPISHMQTTTYDRHNHAIEYAFSKSLAYKTLYEMVAYRDGMGHLLSQNK